MIRCLNCMEIFDEVYGVCPHCGFIPGSPPKEAYHLFPGTVLRGRYIVGTTVGFGGFGITYRAWDKTLDKMVAIKEFYPNGLVNRVPGEKTVIIYSGNRANEFENGKIRFLAEARNMAMFNTHPNIVNVYEFFEENNTAYIAMEFLKGMSFKQYIAAQGGKIGWQTAVSVVLSVLDGLKEIHRAKIIHRDVSPDNIFLVPTDDGKDYRIKLIDFGAARFASGEEEKTLSIILKPGYAPPEQYRSKSRQGPWTDLYAVGAVLYRAITGIMPEEARRVISDRARELVSACFSVTRPFDGPVSRHFDGTRTVQEFEYDGRRIVLPLMGGMQRRNFQLAALVVEKLASTLGIDPERAFRALANCRWPGRCDQVSERLIVDGGHNPDGIASLCEALKETFPGEKFTIVFAGFKDKDVAGGLRLLAELAAWFIFVPLAESDRPSYSGEELIALAKDSGIVADFSAAPDSASALKLAYAGAPRRILAAGSLYLAGEVLAASVDPAAVLNLE